MLLTFVKCQVYFSALSTPSQAQGSTFNLGWAHDGHMTFVLSGKPSTGFWSTGGPADWMHRNLPTIGGRTLKQLAMPGTHDAGMSTITGSTAFGGKCNGQTQTQNIGGQLALGSRYFDIRPAISEFAQLDNLDGVADNLLSGGGNYYTGHYGFVSPLNSWQGTNGESIDNIINDINSFTANNKELVIINLSHVSRVAIALPSPADASDI